VIAFKHLNQQIEKLIFFFISSSATTTATIAAAFNHTDHGHAQKESQKTSNFSYELDT